MAEGVNTGVGASAALDYDAQLMLRVKDGDEWHVRRAPLLPLPE